MSTIVTVPDALSDTLATLSGRVDLRTPDGRRLGWFIPDPRPAPPPGDYAPDPATGKIPLTAGVDALLIPPHLRGPDVVMGEALARMEARRATGPQFSTPINDQDLRDVRSGRGHGDPV